MFGFIDFDCPVGVDVEDAVINDEEWSNDVEVENVDDVDDVLWDKLIK